MKTSIPSHGASIEPGSFRDRRGRVFHSGDAVYRCLSSKGLEAWKALEASALFRRFVSAGKLAPTRQIDAEPGWHQLPACATSWAAVLQHEPIPFISYPYEWCFGMLRDAALLNLELLDAALDEDLILQDGSAYNVQWHGTQPMFIDTLSIVQIVPGQPWPGYRQFCELFLFPLLLQAYKGVPFQPWLRGSLEGITAWECSRLMSWRDLLRPGVFAHVYLQSKLQTRLADTPRDLRAELRGGGFHKDLIRHNVRRLARLIGGLRPKRYASAWAGYDSSASYAGEDQERKTRFIRAAVASRRWKLVWDLGCNTGRYARLAAANADYVVAIDADQASVETLYANLKAEGRRSILPLVGNVADLSPNRGWRGLERKGFQERGRPDLILCLALLHHLVIGAGIPLAEIVDWLATSLRAQPGGTSGLLTEFVTRDDPMVQRLLRHKDDQYADYSLPFFERCLAEKFEVVHREVLASGTRILYFAHLAGGLARRAAGKPAD
jgi:SAM-dependent methyltransferase